MLSAYELLDLSPLYPGNLTKYLDSWSIASSLLKPEGPHVLASLPQITVFSSIKYPHLKVQQFEI